MSEPAKTTKLVALGVGLFAIGYSLGILTAPRSGSATRSKMVYQAKKTKDDLEAELVEVYNKTKNSLRKVSIDNPKVTSKVKAVKDAAEESQKKIKDLISAMGGNDNLDEDLNAALNNARQALSDLKTYVTK